MGYQGVQFVYGIFILVSQSSQSNPNSEWDIPAKHRKCMICSCRFQYFNTCLALNFAFELGGFHDGLAYRILLCFI